MAADHAFANPRVCAHADTVYFELFAALQRLSFARYASWSFPTRVDPPPRWRSRLRRPPAAPAASAACFSFVAADCGALGLLGLDFSAAAAFAAAASAFSALRPRRRRLLRLLLRAASFAAFFSASAAPRRLLLGLGRLLLGLRLRRRELGRGRAPRRMPPKERGAASRLSPPQALLRAADAANALPQHRTRGRGRGRSKQEAKAHRERFLLKLKLYLSWTDGPGC